VSPVPARFHALKGIVTTIHPAAAFADWLPAAVAFLETSVRHYLALAAKDDQGADSPAKLAYATVAALAEQYQNHANIYHFGNASERRQVASVLCLFKACYGGLPMDQFTTVQLKQVRQCLIDGGWILPSGVSAKPYSRVTVNAAIGRLNRCFRWGVEHGLVPPYAGNRTRPCERSKS
jgi:hypothetical protein